MLLAIIRTSTTSHYSSAIRDLSSRPRTAGLVGRSHSREPVKIEYLKKWRRLFLLTKAKERGEKERKEESERLVVRKKNERTKEVDYYSLDSLVKPENDNTGVWDVDSVVIGAWYNQWDWDD